MQISGGRNDDFGPRRLVDIQPPLSSEIVRPIFQRDVTHRDRTAQFNEEWGIKRALTSEQAPAWTPTQSQHHLATVSKIALQQLPTLSDVGAMANHAMRADFPVKKKRIRLKTQRRREQCRANQARYRQKQANYERTLEGSVQALNSEIPGLELQRNCLMHGGNQQTMWGFAVDYFHQFRSGAVNNSGQLEFLRSTLADNVVLGDLCGVDGLMEQWRRWSMYFQGPHFQLEHMRRSSDNFAVATASLKVTVSETTLTVLFPHLTGESADAKSLALGSKLVGCRLLLPCSLCFEWDATNANVIQLQTTTSWVKPLVHVFGNLADVAQVLEHALVSHDGAIGEAASPVSYA